MKTRVILRYFGTYCLWKRFLDYKSPNTPSNLICLKFLELQVLSNCFSLKLEQLSWKESLKICLTCELLFLSFHWGWNLVLEEFQICFRAFFRKIKKVLAEIWLFLNNLVVNKEKKAKENFADSHFHNTFRHFDVLPNYPSATSETMCNYYI